MNGFLGLFGAKRIRPKKRELHELTYTEIVKSGNIRLTSHLSKLSSVTSVFKK